MHDCYIYGYAHSSGVSLSLFVSWLCLNSQSAMNSCVLVCTDFLCGTHESLAIFFAIATSSLQSVITDFVGETVKVEFF